MRVPAHPSLPPVGDASAVGNRTALSRDEERPTLFRTHSGALPLKQPVQLHVRRRPGVGPGFHLLDGGDHLRDAVAREQIGGASVAEVSIDTRGPLAGALWFEDLEQPCENELQRPWRRLKRNRICCVRKAGRPPESFSLASAVRDRPPQASRPERTCLCHAATQASPRGFSIIQPKVLTPHHFDSLDTVAHQLLSWNPDSAPPALVGAS
jgi:hypothetical protein